MRICRTSFALVLGAVLSICFAAATTATADTIVDLGTLGGSYSYAYGINNNGQVVGGAATASGAQNAFLYSNGTMTDLGTLGGTNSVAEGINDAGQIVGASDVAGSSNPAFSIFDTGAFQAFSYAGGSMTNLNITLGGADAAGAAAVNDAGQIAGFAASPPFNSSRAVLDANGNVTELPTFGGSVSYAFGINQTGQTVGFAYTTDAGGGIDHAYVYSNGNLMDLGTLGGAMSVADGINDAGQVVGFSETTGEESNSSFTGAHAFLYSSGVMIDLGTLGGSTSEALGINDAGEVVGYSDTASGAQDAFLDVGDVMIDLNSLLPPDSGWDLEEATAINASGQIVGYGTNPNGQTEAFLLDPSPVAEPTSLTLLCAGIGLLFTIRKRLS